jgi:hypothetical protein
MVQQVNRVLLDLLVLRAQRVTKVKRVLLAWKVLGVKLVTLEKGVLLVLWDLMALKGREGLMGQLELKENVAFQE